MSGIKRIKTEVVSVKKEKPEETKKPDILREKFNLLKEGKVWHNKKEEALLQQLEEKINKDTITPEEFEQYKKIIEKEDTIKNSIGQIHNILEYIDKLNHDLLEVEGQISKRDKLRTASDKKNILEQELNELQVRYEDVERKLKDKGLLSEQEIRELQNEKENILSKIQENNSQYIEQEKILRTGLQEKQNDKNSEELQHKRDLIKSQIAKANIVAQMLLSGKNWDDIYINVDRFQANTFKEKSKGTMQATIDSFRGALVDAKQERRKTEAEINNIASELNEAVKQVEELSKKVETAPQDAQAQFEQAKREMQSRIEQAQIELNTAQEEFDIRNNEYNLVYQKLNQITNVTQKSEKYKLRHPILAKILNFASKIFSRKDYYITQNSDIEGLEQDAQIKYDEANEAYRNLENAREILQSAIQEERNLEVEKNKKIEQTKAAKEAAEAEKAKKVLEKEEAEKKLLDKRKEEEKAATELSEVEGRATEGNDFLSRIKIIAEKGYEEMTAQEKATKQKKLEAKLEEMRAANRDREEKKFGKDYADKSRKEPEETER